MTIIDSQSAVLGPIEPAAVELTQSENTALTTKEEYRSFCRREPTLPLFARAWWLDAAVGPEGWDVALVKKGMQVLASMPYVLRKRYGMRIVSQPALTPILGPWFRDFDGMQARKQGHDIELMQSLIDQLPPFDHYSQTWHSSITNWQPFFWSGFRQTTYYTNVLRDLSDLEKLWAGLDGNARRLIKRARNERHLTVRDDLPLDVLLELNRKTFQRQGLKPPFSDEYVRKLDAACLKQACRKLHVVVDEAGVPYSASYFVWDENSAYGLLAGHDPSYRQSGAPSLCLWSTIQSAASLTREYNLCGSMIPPVAAFMRAFGGEHVPYFHVSKTPSKLISIRQGLLSLMKAH